MTKKIISTAKITVKMLNYTTFHLHCAHQVPERSGFFDGQTPDWSCAGKLHKYKSIFRSYEWFCYDGIISIYHNQNVFTRPVLCCITCNFSYASKCQAGAARPMTAVSAAGYSSSLTRGESVGAKQNCNLLFLGLFLSEFLPSLFVAM